MNLYLGSCRYGPSGLKLNNNINWLSFPARLHTTKEIIYFLENIENLNNMITLFSKELINYIFGNFYHSLVIDDINIFLNTKIDTKQLKNLFLEISSRNIYYYKNIIPINAYLAELNTEIIEKYNLQHHILNDDEIKNDIIYICLLINNKFSLNTKITIITHVDLKLSKTKQYIEKRHNFIILLETICSELNINIVNPGKIFEKIYGENVVMDDK